MAINAPEIVRQYVDWLRDNITYKNIGDDIMAIDSPFLDVHNDYIRIYIKKLPDNAYYLTDDGFTMHDLKTNNVNLSENRKRFFETFINGQGVKFNEKSEELFVISSWETLPQRKNDLMQAILNVGDMFMLAKPFVKQLFYEDVAEFFEERGVSATPDVYIEGQGFKERVDFVIPKTSKSPEKLILLINEPEKQQYKKQMFVFYDVRAGKSVHSEAEQIIIINDTERKPDEADLRAIESFKIRPLLWSEREENTELFR